MFSAFLKTHRFERHLVLHKNTIFKNKMCAKEDIKVCKSRKFQNYKKVKKEVGVFVWATNQNLTSFNSNELFRNYKIFQKHYFLKAKSMFIF